jgi:hypothetical protein
MFSRKIREYKLANPNATAKEIAEVVGVRVNYVYQALRLKPTRSTKVKAEKPITKLTLATAGQELLRKEILRLNHGMDTWERTCELQERRINALTEQLREAKLHHGGLEYVISYLESRLGIKEQDGTTV